VLPDVAVFDEFRPEGVEAALDGLDGVDGAPFVGLQKLALAVSGLAEAQLVRRTINVLCLERGGRETQMVGDAEQVVFRNVD